MKAICPHCHQSIEIAPDVLEILRGQTHFKCPACSGDIEVPTSTTRRPVTLATGPSPVAGPRPPGTRAPIGARGGQTTLASAQRGLNRNLLVLGSLTLLTLGGLGAFIASRNRGNTHVTEQKVNNEIIQNSYFTRLIASGATTEKDLNAVADIRPYGEGFIGISKQPLNWMESLALAGRTGSSILEVQDSPPGSRQSLLAWLADSVPGHSSATLWVTEQETPRILDGSDVLAAASLDKPRKVLLQWGLQRPEPPPTDQVAKVAPDQSTSRAIQFKLDENQDTAIAVIKQLGGTYKQGPASRGSPITEVLLALCKPDASNLRSLQGLHNLEVLDLTGSAAGDSGLEELREMKSLRTLYLWGASGISDAGLANLSDLNELRTLNIGYTGVETITGEGLIHLKHLTKLEDLGLNVLNNLRDENLAHISGLTNLKALHIGHCPRLTDNALRHLMPLSYLQALVLVDTQITDTGLRMLHGLKQLRSIKVKGTRTTEAGLAELQKALPNLNIIRQ